MHWLLTPERFYAALNLVAGDSLGSKDFGFETGIFDPGIGGVGRRTLLRGGI